MKRGLLIVLAFSVALSAGGFLGCSSSDDNNAIVPKGGIWTGSNIQFNVSTDGTRLTPTSAIGSGPDPCSVLAISGNVQTCFGVEMSISNGTFSYDDGTNSVSGTFSSTTTASGSFTLSGGGLSSGANWTAASAE